MKNNIKIVLLVSLLFLAISCGDDERNNTLDTVIKIDKALSDELTGGKIEINIYHTSTFMCDKITKKCTTSDYQNLSTPMKKDIAYDDRKNAKTDYILLKKEGYYLVTALGKDSNGDEKTKIACSCAFRPETETEPEKYKVERGYRYNVNLRLKAKE